MVYKLFDKIDKMFDEDVPCEDILVQINVSKSALHKVGQVGLEGPGLTIQKRLPKENIKLSFGSLSAYLSAELCSSQLCCIKI